MSWTIEYAASLAKTLKSIDRSSRKRIRDFLEHRVANMDDPRVIGKPLKGKLAQLWRYRVGPYRIVCSIEPDRCVVLVLRVAHRKHVYKESPGPKG